MTYHPAVNGPRLARALLQFCWLPAALLLATPLHGQVTSASETYAVPQWIDGSSHSAFFDFTGNSAATGAVSVSALTLSITFTKTPDLPDDPPFYSDMGLVLRMLDTTFAVLREVTLIEVGTLPDGAPFSGFSGTLRFDDAAETALVDAGDPLLAGAYRPFQPLAGLLGGFSPYWELRIDDASIQNPILFDAATLTLSLAAQPVPEPAAYGAVASGFLLSLVVFVRRRLRR